MTATDERAPSAERARSTAKATERGRRVLLWSALAIAALVAFFPLYWMFATAVRPATEIFADPVPLVPSEFRFSNFVDAWQLLPFERFYLNSLLISGLAVALTVTINLLCGYALAKFRFVGKKLFFFALVGTLMIPIQVLMIPQFRIVAGLGWLNSIWAVIIPMSAEAFGIFLARQFMMTVPDELLEAARVDGAGEFGIFFRIVLPISKPLIAVLVIFTFQWRWNGFAWPLIVLRDQESMTVPVGLSLMRGQFTTDFTALMSMTLVSTIPMIVVFLIFQRYFVQGIGTTGIK